MKKSFVGFICNIYHFQTRDSYVGYRQCYLCAMTHNNGTLNDDDLNTIEWLSPKGVKNALIEP